MSGSDEESDSDFCYLSLKAIIFTPKTMYSYNLNIDSVLQATLQTIRLSEHDEKGSEIPSPKSSTDSRLKFTSSHKFQKDSSKKISKQVYSVLEYSMPMIKELTTPLFWIVQLKITFPEKTKDIDDLEAYVSKIYREFCYKFQTNGQIPSKVLDRFIYCLPYFFTQAIQDIFIRLLQGNPSCMDRDFRMRVCSILVELFTGIKPIDTLLKSRLSFYFARPPDADIPELGDKKHKDEEELCASVSIPTEDLSTLVDLPKRKRPSVYSWHSSSVSPFISKGLNRSVLPYSHDSILHLTLPKNGEDDWKSDLPPLLSNNDQSEVTDISKYDPSKDSRSLLYRARRPNIISDFKQNSIEFMRLTAKRKAKEEIDVVYLRNKKEKVRRKDPLVLEEWVKDLAKLQQEKKHGETPEFKRLADIKNEKTKEQLRREKEEKEREESENTFNYEPYYDVCELSDKIITQLSDKPTYSKLNERESIFENFRLHL